LPPSRLLAPAMLLSLLVFAFSIQSAEAQGGAVRGRVYARDALRNLVPVGFSTIIIKGGSFETSARTDADGYYLVYLPAGTYLMTAMLSTVTLYYSQSKTVAVWYASDTTVNFYMEPSAPESPSISAMISVDDLPSQYSVELKVDNSQYGVIQGGGKREIRVKSELSHSFSVQPYLEVSKGERYYCQSNSWTLDKSVGPSGEAEVSHTFSYTQQYLLSVSTSHGDAAKNSGWHARGYSVTLETPRMVEISQGVRSVFDGWVASGSENKDSSLRVVLNSPLEARANYHKEYYLQIVSQYGKPSGSGWYREGSNAVISVERDLPSPGLMGALGGRNVFSGWSGDKISSNNAADVLMDSPKAVAANWTADYSTPYLIILMTAVLIIVAMVFLAQKRIIRGHRETEEQ